MALPQLIVRIIAGIAVVGFRSARQAYRQAANAAPKVEMQTPEWAQKLGFGSNERYQEMRLPEAINILGLTKADKLPEVKARFDHLLKANDPEKGGSEYLLGKIHGAHDMITRNLNEEMTIDQLAKKAAEFENANAKKDEL